MGKSTISMAIFNSFVYVYQRVMSLASLAVTPWEWNRMKENSMCGYGLMLSREDIVDQLEFAQFFVPMLIIEKMPTIRWTFSLDFFKQASDCFQVLSILLEWFFCICESSHHRRGGLWILWWTSRNGPLRIPETKSCSKSSSEGDIAKSHWPGQNSPRRDARKKGRCLTVRRSSLW